MKGIIHEKVTIWRSSVYELDTNDPKIARELLEKEAKKQEFPDEGDIVFIESELLYETESPLYGEEGVPIKEIVIEEDDDEDEEEDEDE